MEEEKKCHCHEGCTCGEDCQCTSEDKCCDECTCGQQNESNSECKCCAHDACTCEQGCNCKEEQEDYLLLAKRVQADFDNYRRRSIEERAQARQAGQMSVLDAFLPCLDTFKEAKRLITDEKVLEGVNMIENKILASLAELGVEKMQTIGAKYDAHLHNAIAVMRDEEKENNIILDEYQAGYTMNGKVIKYAKVIVNKKED